MSKNEKEALARRKESRRGLKTRHAERLKLIRQSVNQARNFGIGDKESHYRGAWDYEIAADSDIFTRCCPLCFQAYSDFEVTALSPCWHCRDKMSLCSAVAIGDSVSIVVEDRYSHEEPCELDDNTQLEFLREEIGNIERRETFYVEELGDALRCQAVEPCYKNQHHVWRCKARLNEHLSLRESDIANLEERISAIQSGKEKEYLANIVEKEKALQAGKLEGKNKGVRTRMRGRWNKLLSVLERNCGDVYTFDIESYPPRIQCTGCDGIGALDVSMRDAASKSIEEIMSSRAMRIQICEFTIEHAKHTGRKVSLEQITSQRYYGW